MPSRGPWSELAPYGAFMGYTRPWFSVEHVDDPLLGPETEGAYVALLRRGDRVRATSWITGRGTELAMTSLSLLDMTAYGRQEAWEDAPEGWPRDPTFTGWVRDGRPCPSGAVRARRRSTHPPTTTESQRRRWSLDRVERMSDHRRR